MNFDDMVRVSIVTPLFNKGEFLEETIRSVQSQTVSEWEMLIVNNFSTDGGAVIAVRLADQDDRIRLLECRHTRGPGAARNVGLDSSVGDWVLFLDADDLLEPYYLEKKLAIAYSGPCVDVIVGGWQEFSGQTPNAMNHLRRPAGWVGGCKRLESSAIIIAPWAVHAAIVRRAHLSDDRRWREEFDGGPSEDSSFWFPVVLGARVTWSSDLGALYRINTQTSRNACPIREKWFDALQAISNQNLLYLRHSGQKLTSSQCAFAVRVFENEYLRALESGDFELAARALQLAYRWLNGTFFCSFPMFLRKIVGLELFQKVRVLFRKSADGN